MSFNFFRVRGVLRVIFALLFALGFIIAFLQTLSDEENRAMLIRSLSNNADGNTLPVTRPLQFLSRISTAFLSTNETEDEDETMLEMFTGENDGHSDRRIKHLGRLHPRHFTADDSLWQQAFYKAYLLPANSLGHNKSYVELLQIISRPPKYQSVPSTFSFQDMDKPLEQRKMVSDNLYETVWSNFTLQRRQNHYETVNVVLPFRRGPAEERYVRLCSSYGLFCNTLIVIVKAYAFAGLLNRTLVLPKRFFLIWDKQELDKGPVRVISTEDYISRKIPVVEEGCMHNTDTYCCRFMRDALWTDTPYTTVVLHARTLFHGLDTFYLTMFAERYFLCMFHYLKPVPIIQRDVDETLKLLPAKYLAVHLRNKWTAMDRPECIKQLLPWSYWYNDLIQMPWNLTGDECIMDPSLVNCYRNDSQTPFFLGTDNINRTATGLLVNIGAIRHKPSSALQEYGELLEKLERGMGPFPYLVVDIILMSKGIEFIGNPISSFSGVICGIRMAHGLRCVNSPPIMYNTQCVGYPDTRNMFLHWSKLFSQRKTKVSVIKWNLTTCARHKVYEEYNRISSLNYKNKFGVMSGSSVF